MIVDGAPTCTQHTAAKAGWTCHACQRMLCSQCAVRRKAGEGYLTQCGHCGGFAELLMRRRRRGAFLDLLPGAVVYPFTRNGLLTMIACGIAFTFLGFLGPIGLLLGGGAFASYLFLVIRMTAMGHEDVPESEDIAHPFDLIAALARFLSSMLLAIAPLAAYLYFLKPRFAGSTVPQWLAHYLLDPLIYLSFLPGLLWVPMALILAATQSPFTTMLNPVAAALFIRRLGFDFLLAAVAFWFLQFCGVILAGFGQAFAAAVPVPLIPTVIGEAFRMYIPLVWARELGLLLHARGSDIGYGTAEDSAEPVLPNAVAREETPADSAQKPAPVDDAPLTLDLMDSLVASDPAAPRVAPAPQSDDALDFLDDRPVPPPRAQKPTIEGELTTEEDFLRQHEVPPQQVSSGATEAPSTPERPDEGSADPPRQGWTPARGVASPPAPPPVFPTRSAPPPIPKADVRPLMIGGSRAPAPPPRATPAVPPKFKPAADDPNADILANIDAGKWKLVVDAYSAKKGKVADLPFNVLVRIAGIAEADHEFETATHAYHRAATDHPTNPAAGDALLAAARVLSRNLDRHAEAEGLLRYITEAFPGTTAAEAALEALGSGL